ncbi:MAG: terpene synthase family protein [Chloroflexota bacterium]
MQEQKMTRPNRKAFSSIFLKTKSVTEAARINEQSKTLINELTHWSSQFPSILQTRIPPLSLILTATYPANNLDALLLTGMTNLWIFAVDDLFDSATLSTKSLSELTEKFNLIITEAPSPTLLNDELGQILGNIRKDVAKFSLFEHLESNWCNAFKNMLNGMVKEAIWREKFQLFNELPDLDGYLENGLNTVGGPPHIWTTLITTNDFSLLKVQKALDEMVLTASACIRLANDWQSYGKEIKEGSFNSLTIWENHQRCNLSGEFALEEAKKCLIAQIEEELERLKRLKIDINTETGLPETVIVNIAEFVSEFYMQHDFHTMTRKTCLPFE